MVFFFEHLQSVFEQTNGNVRSGYRSCAIEHASAVVLSLISLSDKASC